MSQLQMWSLIAGFFLPPVQAAIQQYHWPEQVRSIVNFLCCAVVAVGVVYFTGDVDFHRWVEAGLLILVTAISVYHGAWKPSGISRSIERNVLNTKKGP